MGVGKTHMMKAWNRIKSQGLIKFNDDGTCDMDEHRVHVPIPTLDVMVKNYRSVVQEILLDYVPKYVPDYDDHLYFDLDDMPKEVYDILHESVFDEDNSFNQPAQESDITVDDKFRRLYVEDEGAGMMAAFSNTPEVDSPVLFLVRYR